MENPRPVEPEPEPDETQFWHGLSNERRTALQVTAALLGRSVRELLLIRIDASSAQQFSDPENPAATHPDVSASNLNFAFADPDLDVFEALHYDPLASEYLGIADGPSFTQPEPDFDPSWFGQAGQDFDDSLELLDSFDLNTASEHGASSAITNLRDILLETDETINDPFSLRCNNVQVMPHDTSTNSSSSLSSWINITPPSERAHSPTQRSLSANPNKEPQDTLDLDQTPSSSSRRRKTPSHVTGSTHSRSNGSERIGRANRQEEGVLQASRNRKSRGAFTTEQDRDNTALTRKLNACMRCRNLRIRCEPNPVNPNGQCLTCAKRSRPRLSVLPCLRYRISDVSLYREELRPNVIWTSRWQNNESHNVTTWANDQIRRVRVTQGLPQASYELEVREFQANPGDSLEKIWVHNGEVKKVAIRPFAIVDMSQAATVGKQYLDENVLKYVTDTMSSEDPLIQETYRMAYRQATESEKPEERILLSSVLRLWVAARVASRTEWICGDDTLGMKPVADPSSPYYGRIPLPPVMSAQISIISQQFMLKPFKLAVLETLHGLTSKQKKRYWLAIYLAIFILLHGCSMMTKRDEEYARQINLGTRFANPESIRDHHHGCLILLQYFHSRNRGRQPFALTEDPKGLDELRKFGEFDQVQVEFVRRTWERVRRNWTSMIEARDKKDFGNSYYFVSQLFDEPWKPSSTA
ncbi:hypothetical protein CLAIMM_10812 isoform 1 [Cladophialophora immunda]|nr:hypothetical protein CLAIMM_10812 isoform 1 [Cladophialophora immunda]